MALLKFPLLFFLTFTTIPLGTSSSPRPDNVESWCTSLPYPTLCTSFMSKHKSNQVSDLRYMAMEAALRQAMAVHGHTLRRGQNCKTNNERAALADCTQLYDNTIAQLNQALQCIHNRNTGGPRCTDFDIQTWLSAASTNLETCKDSIVELNVTNVLLPHMSHKVSELITNCLAINYKIMMRNKKHHHHHHHHDRDDGFPSWVGRKERRLLTSTTRARFKPRLIVAQDNSGQFTTVQEAIDAAKEIGGDERVIILVRAGVYEENILVDRFTKNIMLLGEGTDSTNITGSRSASQGYSTYNTSTIGIDGPGFIAQGITFLNTAGPEAGQAVALRSSSDKSVFYQCVFYGYQDTLFTHSQTQFYKDCEIYGTMDFIFGNAASIFQNCAIYARKRPGDHYCLVITAQGRDIPYQNTGIVIQDSLVGAAPDLVPALDAAKIYLGRPWKPYSRTVIMKSDLGGFIDPAGWLEAGEESKLSTLFYAEYDNVGPGSSLDERVKWPGYHIISSKEEASEFTVRRFIAGKSWLPQTRMPFKSDL